MVGGALSHVLVQAGHEIVAFSREPGGVEADFEAARFDPGSGEIDDEALGGSAAVVHLAGASVAARWTEKQRRRIRDSRVEGTRLLVDAMARLSEAARPRVLVSASAVGYYGDRGDDPLDETAARGDGFLADVCTDWEAEAGRAESLGVRVVRLRIGMVLSAEGGALARMLRPFKMGLGGRVGSGKQWVSWIHLDDLVRAIRCCIDDERLRGAVNATAPKPVKNAELTSALGSAIGRPTVLPAPRLALKLLFGAMAEELLLASQRAVPEQLVKVGFEYRFSEIDAALQDLLSH
ncbi:MAG: TIGR01777 family oxidoreductase [Myxococcales bacterium]|nr:TIGR01777 family oxidoreductase [Myxococcales bacterium]